MKLFLTLAMTLTFVSTAMAANTTCTGDGFTAVVKGPKATLSYEGKKIANLKLESTEGTPGGDQFVTANYSQAIVNGYALSVTTGGYAGMASASATVFHDGFAGLTAVGSLKCR